MITTRRLRLRGWTERDADDFRRLVGDPEVMRFSPTGPLERAAAVERLLVLVRAQARDGFSPWAAVRRDTGELAGMIGLGRPWFLAGWEREVEAVWRLLPAHRGRGLATEGAAAAVAWAFSTLGAERVLGIVEPANVPSLRVARRLGMEVIARERLGDRTVLVHSVRSGCHPAT